MPATNPFPAWKFTITRDDYFNAIKSVTRDLHKNRSQYLPSSTGYQWVNLAIILGMGGIFGFLIIYLRDHFPADVQWIFGGSLIMLGAGIVFLIQNSLTNYKFYPRDNGSCLGQFKLTVNKTHMKLEGIMQTSLTRLDRIFKIELSDDLVLVFFDPHIALPIPKRDIGDEAACLNLIAALTPGK